MFKSVFAGALATLVAGAAMAADLPRRSAAYAPSPVFAKPFSWTGLYAGLNAGYAFGETTKSAKNLVGDVDGPTVGATLGYNYQIQQFVIGAESDLAWANIDGSKGTNKAKFNTIGTARARAGYAADRALVYVTGGYAGGNLKVATTLGSESDWRHGYALGAGLEYSFTDNLSAKAEYLYTDLNAKNYRLDPVTTAGAQLNSIRTGVNYKF